MGIGDWGLGIGGWGFGVCGRGPNPQTPKTPIPNPQSPFFSQNFLLNGLILK